MEQICNPRCDTRKGNHDDKTLDTDFVACISLFCRSRQKTETFAMPPLVSHEQPLTNYACVFTPTSQVSAVEYWTVLAFAEYGKGHKRYWTKSLGTFRGNESIASHNAESAGGGEAIGLIAENVQHGDAGKICSEWEGAVQEEAAAAKAAQSK
jgi:hypothetical protein